jgi:HD superfamily phosphohydrolase YqeK
MSNEKLALLSKTEVFKEELDLIFDKNIRSFTELCLMLAPDYFFTDCPASSSGKYHPLDELSWDGCIIHTKRVVTVAYDLSRGLGCEENRDSIVSACIIHDLRKQGLTRTGHTQKNHPDLAAKLVEEVQRDTKLLSDKDYNIIYNAVGYHYGPWSQLKWKKTLSKYTPEEMCVYLSDYIASKKTCKVKYENRFGE